MNLQVIHHQDELTEVRRGHALLMFGGADCSVCVAVKPKIETLLDTEFPQLRGFYLDCQGDAHAVCAQEGIFSIPTIQLWFDGRKHAEFQRVFSISDVRQAIAKPYSLLHD